MRELANTCKRTDVGKEYDKMLAAQHQLEGAITNLFLGNWPAAITLAGAAEGILPVHEKYDDLFSTATKRGPQVFGHSSKEIADKLNELRDWLKHHQSDNPNRSDKQIITQDDAVSVVMRAYTRFCAHNQPVGLNESLSEHLFVFENWFRKNYPDWLQDKNKQKR